MPKFTVTVPVFTRVEEVYHVEADTIEAALAAIYSEEYQELVPDPDYYEPEKSGIRVELRAEEVPPPETHTLVEGIEDSVRAAQDVQFYAALAEVAEAPESFVLTPAAVQETKRRVEAASFPEKHPLYQAELERALAEVVVEPNLAPAPCIAGLEGVEIVTTAATDDRPVHVSVHIEGLTVDMGRSPLDGVFVVEICGPGEGDTQEDGSPRLRLYINEENTYENPPPPAPSSPGGKFDHFSDLIRTHLSPGFVEKSMPLKKL